ncbi:hypothetical protein AVM15_14385 [Paraclostridium benzoelyticum]|nr:hypothetical protein AVM15_14385 [Paraclostridium benzoelyticum]
MKLKKIDNLSYSVIKFSSKEPVPNEFSTIRDFKSITYTDEECSIVAPTGSINTDNALSVDDEWFIIKIVGVLDFSLVGILTQLANPLAENKISIFALSTYNTDYLLIKEKDKDKAINVLQNSGHEFI